MISIKATIKSYISKLYDYYIDGKLGIDTIGIYHTDIKSKFDDGVECSPTSYRLLNQIKRHIKILDIQRQVFVDYGCGKGRVVCYFAQFQFESIIGLDISELWVTASLNNIENLKNKQAKKLQVFHLDAINFDPTHGTIFYLFNPFGQKTLSTVLNNIERTLLSNPRQIYLIYYNTVHIDILKKCEWLTIDSVVQEDNYGNPTIIIFKNDIA